MNPGYPIINLPSGYPLMANQVYRKIEHEMENEVYTWAFVITAISGCTSLQIVLFRWASQDPSGPRNPKTKRPESQQGGHNQNNDKAPMASQQAGPSSSREP